MIRTVLSVSGPARKAQRPLLNLISYICLMKTSIILQVVIGITFLTDLTEWVFSDDIKPFYSLMQKASSLRAVGQTFLSVYHCQTGMSDLPNIPLVEGQPDILFEESIFNFGKVYRHEDVKHAFMFQNHGTKELKIEKIEASCGCIVVEELATMDVAPGMTGRIDVNLRTPDPGAITKSIRIYSNDPDTPVYTLKLSGEVIEDITVNPRQINFGHIFKGEKAHAEVHLQPRLGFDIEIKDVMTSNPVVSIKYKKEEQENRYIVNATLNEDTMVGVWTGNIYILTNSERQRQLIVSFFGEVIGDIKLYPPHIYFGVIKKGSEQVKSAFLTLLNEKIKVEKIEVQPDILVSEVVIEPQEDAGEKKRLTLRILNKIKKDAPLGQINSIVKIYTNSKIQPIIDIPVSGEIVEK